MNIEDLALWGADVKDGLARCMNMEAFYLRLVESVKTEKRFEELAAALEAGEVEAAFGAAHALKGVLGNLSLTPLYEPMCELTEALRGKDSLEGVEYQELADAIASRLEAFRAL